jgi:hypothetical protein
LPGSLSLLHLIALYTLAEHTFQRWWSVTEASVSCSTDSGYLELEIELIELAICRHWSLAAHESGWLNCEKATMNYEAFQLRRSSWVLSVIIIRTSRLEALVLCRCNMKVCPWHVWYWTGR